MLFPRISRIVLLIDVDRKTGEVKVTVQYPGLEFDPLAPNTDVAAESAKAELRARIKSVKYLSSANGKNELTLIM